MLVFQGGTVKLGASGHGAWEWENKKCQQNLTNPNRTTAPQVDVVGRAKGAIVDVWS